MPKVTTTQVISATITMPTMTDMPPPFTADNNNPPTRQSISPYPISMARFKITQSLLGHHPIVYLATFNVRNPDRGPNVEMYPVHTEPKIVPNMQIRIESVRPSP